MQVIFLIGLGFVGKVLIVPRRGLGCHNVLPFAKPPQFAGFWRLAPMFRARLTDD